METIRGEKSVEVSHRGWHKRSKIVGEVNTELSMQWSVQLILQALFFMRTSEFHLRLGGKKKTTTNELTTSFLLSKSCEYVARLITVDMRVCCLVTLLRPSIIVELTIAQDVPAQCEDVSDYEGEPAQFSRQPLTL